MPRVCSICTHPERKRIDGAIVEQLPNRRIASQYGVTERAVRHHKAHHLPARLAKAKEAREMTDAEKLLRTLEALLGRAVRILDTAEHSGDYRSALGGIREARACVETLLEVQGELQRGTTVNVIQSAEWQQISTVILHALIPYPEAREAVARAVAEMQA